MSIFNEPCFVIVWCIEHELAGPRIAGKEKVKLPLAGSNFQWEDCGWLVRRGSTEEERELVSLF